MFQVKICGITSVEDAEIVVAAGADAIGLNFYSGSPRHVSVELACEIVRVVPVSVVKVGLFVNAPSAHIRETGERLGLDLVQLHGDEPPEFLAELSDCRSPGFSLPASAEAAARFRNPQAKAWTPAVMRAFRVGRDGLAPVGHHLARSRELGCVPALVLLDAFSPHQHGGTGQTSDWTVARAYPLEEWHPPLVLAGGLNAENVAEAIATVHPAAVDTASGVEQSPGKKSPEKVLRFVREARKALNGG